MSTVVSKEDDLKNIALLYNLLYGSDIKIEGISNRPYMALAIENGDFVVTGIVEGNSFGEAISISIQRYLVELYTPLSTEGFRGSNFIRFTRSLEGVDTDTKVRILKAELLLVGLKIPQIKTVTSVRHRIIDAFTIAFQVEFELMTGERTDFVVTGVA